MSKINLEKLKAWQPKETELDPWGPLRGSQGLQGLVEDPRLNDSNGQMLGKLAILAVTQMMATSERFAQFHGLGSNPVPDRNLKESVGAADRKKIEAGWPAMNPELIAQSKGLSKD